MPRIWVNVALLDCTSQPGGELPYDYCAGCFPFALARWRTRFPGAESKALLITDDLAMRPKYEGSGYDCDDCGVELGQADEVVGAGR